MKPNDSAALWILCNKTRGRLTAKPSLPRSGGQCRKLGA